MQLRPGFWNVIDKLSNYGEITIPSGISSMSSSIQIFDEEKYLPPIDVSTNLFYYKGSPDGIDPTNTEIKDDDEVIIINARKMANELNQIDLEPGDANLALCLDQLKDKELTLTAYIPCTSSDWETWLKPISIYTRS